VSIQCENAVSLVPSYTDGELSEEQAGPLRRHLLDCPACREAAQGEQALKRWFVADEPMTVPAGFASRVARRAFAGDTGERPGRLPRHPDPAAPPSDARILLFVLKLTAVAAAILFVLALGIRKQRLPEDPGLVADEPWQDVRQELERLNDEEASVDEEPAADQDASRSE
jgi:anti-sigma factor RsiW